MSGAIGESVLTCPHCGFARQETMPVDACQFYYVCAHCLALLRPKPGDLRVWLLRLGEVSAGSGATGVL